MRIGEVTIEGVPTRLGSWLVVRVSGNARELQVADDWVDRGVRTVRLCRVTSRAVVLGSAQRATDLDLERADASGVEVCRRRSGGGAVLVGPAAQVWLEVFVPVGDRLFETDVGRSFWWLGECAAGAVGSLVDGAVEVHKGPSLTTPWSRRLCFAGVGAGEVRLNGRKVFAISQHRDRRGASLHSELVLEDQSDLLVFLTAGSEEARRAAASELRSMTGVVPVAHEAAEAALLAELSAVP